MLEKYFIFVCCFHFQIRHSVWNLSPESHIRMVVRFKMESNMTYYLSIFGTTEQYSKRILSVPYQGSIEKEEMKKTYANRKGRRKHTPKKMHWSGFFDKQITKKAKTTQKIVNEWILNGWKKKKNAHGQKRNWSTRLKKRKEPLEQKQWKKKQAKFFFNEILHCFFFSPIFDYMVLLSGTVFV